MQIKTFTIKNFKKFANETFEFESGINIVLGPNEAGKSTLAEGILTCLFADPTTKSKRFLEITGTWGKLDSKPPVFEMEFSHKNSGYFLRKNFEKKEAVLEELNSSSRITNKAKIEQFLKKALGLSSENIFLSTGFVAQSDILEIKKTNDFFAAVQNATSGTGKDGNIQKHLLSLENEIKELQKGMQSPSKNPGYIKYYKDQIERKSLELNEKSEHWKVMVDEIKRLKMKREERKRIEEEINILEKMILNHDKLKNATIKLANINENIKSISTSLRNIENLKTNIKKMNLKLDRYKKFKGVDLDNLLINFGSVNNEINSKQELISQIDYEINQLNLKPFSSTWKFLIIALMGFSFLIITLSLFLKNLLMFEIGAVGGFTGFLIFIIFIYLRTKDRKNLINRQKNLSEIMERDEQKLEKILSDFDITTKEQFMDIKTEIRSLGVEVEKARANIKGILQGKSIEQLEEEEVELLSQKREIEVNDLTNEILNSELTIDQYTRKKMKLDEMQKKYRILHESILNLEGKLNDKNSYIEEIGQLEIELQDFEKNLKYYSYKLQILSKLQEYLEKALNDTSVLAVDILQKEIEHYFPLITMQNYNKIKINERFDLEVFSTRLNDWLEPAGKLSAGTIDQIFFLFRLAFYKLLVKGEKTILILDDPFVSFDADRLKNAMGILKEESRQFQIIFLTHDERYKEYGNLIRIY